ncbi:MAG TPA: RNA-binding protein [Agriterribacter sp.]|nr:RNA-binding protein [Agriterribacter sp.]
MNIYVSNLSFNVVDEDLKAFFEEYGEVSSARVITDKFTGRSRGFGFVEMPNDEEAQKAISELDKGVVEGRPITVTEAKPREERSNSNGGGNRRSFAGSSNRGGGRY